MDEAKLAAHRATAARIIRKLELRNMTGHYCETSVEAVELALSLVAPGQEVTWGGSASFVQSGIKAALESHGARMLDRSGATTGPEREEMWRRQVSADWFFMGANAVTLDGELVNIDGNANRLALLLHGPEHVFVIAGMNKVVADVESGIKRIRTSTCPINAARLHTGTPCELTGACADCHSKGCMCCQEVVTRHSRHDGRIHVALVGEDLGF